MDRFWWNLHTFIESNFKKKLPIKLNLSLKSLKVRYDVCSLCCYIFFCVRRSCKTVNCIFVTHYCKRQVICCWTNVLRMQFDFRARWKFLHSKCANRFSPERQVFVLLRSIDIKLKFEQLSFRVVFTSERKINVHIHLRRSVIPKLIFNLREHAAKEKGPANFIVQFSSIKKKIVQNYYKYYVKIGACF